MGNSESRESRGASSASTGTRRSLPPGSAVVTRRTAARSASAGSERECANARRLPPPPASVESSSYCSSSCSACTDGDGALHGERGGLERGQKATEETSAQLNYWYLLKHGYTELVHLIIRPPRTQYEPEELGPPSFRFAGRDFQRKDFGVRNDRQQMLRCSLWRPAAATDHLLPCVVYLHGNSSCRLEALGVLRTCLAAGLSVCAFDTAGCGQSEGDYISLGYYERDDLRDVVTHLRGQESVGCVALWGRSMGAATALLHADRDPSIAGIIVDSAFASLEQLVQEVVERGRQEGLTLPKFLVKIVLKFIRSSVQKRAHFDLRKLAPIDHAAASFVPALFVAAESDSFVAPHHSDQIFAVYGGDKNLVKVEGDHNSSRPQFLLDSAAIFLQSVLQVEASSLVGLDEFTVGGSRAPWKDGGEHGAMGQASELSMGSSPASSYRMTMDLDARFSGKNALLVPVEPWACPSCTFMNRALAMQCEMCHDIYFPDEEVQDPQTEARRRATTDGSMQPPPAPRQTREERRRRSLGATPVNSEVSTVLSTSTQRPPISSRSSAATTTPAMATATTPATSASPASS